MAGNRSVKVTLEADVNRFVAAMGQAKASVAGFGDSASKNISLAAARADDGAQRMARSMQANRAAWDVAGKALLGFGIATTAGVGMSVKAAMNWESAWTGVTKTVDGSAAVMGKLQDDLRGMARTLPSTHTEIAAVAEAAGQLGVKAGDVATFTKTMIDLGQTTNLSAEEAATTLARFNNIMGLQNKDVGYLGSAIVALGNNTATTEREIADFGLRLAASGRQAGLTAAEVLAFGASLSSVGVEAEAGGTAFSKVFTKIADASRSGGKDLETFARIAGVSTGEFKRMFETDGAGAVSAFVAGMGDMSKAGQSTTEVFKSLGMQDERLKRSVLSLGQAHETLAANLELARGAFGSMDALLEEANKRYGTAESKLAMLKNQITDAGISMGQAFLPVVAEVAKSVGGLAYAFGQLPEPVQKAVGIIGGGVGAVSLLGGAYAMLAPRLLDSVEAMRNVSGVSATTSNRLGKVSRGLGALTGFALGPWGLAAAAGVTVLAGALGNAAAEAQATQDRIKALQGTLDSGTGGFTGATMQALASSMVDKDLWGGKGPQQGFKDMGFSADDVVKALDGDAKKRKEIEAALKKQDQAYTARVLTGIPTGGLADRGSFLAASGWFEEQTRAIDKGRESITQTKKATDELADAQLTLSQQTLTTSSSFDRMQTALGMSAEDAEKYVAEMSKVSLSFINLGDSADQGFGKWAAAQQKSISDMQNWHKNLLLIAASGDAELAKMLQQMGPAGAQLVSELVDGVDDAAQKAQARVFASAGDLSKTFINVFEDPVALGLIRVASEQLSSEAFAGFLDGLLQGGDLAALAEQYSLSIPITADTGPFTAELNGIKIEMDRTSGAITINGKPAPAETTLGELIGNVNEADGTVTINGNKAPAEMTVTDFLVYVAGVNPKVNLTVDTGGATAAVQAWKAKMSAGLSIPVYTNMYGGNPTGGLVTKKAAGGIVTGPGHDTSDTIPALLSPGEYVIRAKAARSIGYSVLNDLNALRFASGGMVPGGNTTKISPLTQGPRVVQYLTQNIYYPRPQSPALAKNKAGQKLATAGVY